MSRNGRNNVLLGLSVLAEDNFENRGKSTITNHLMFPVRYCQRETIYFFFYKFDKFEIDFRACFK